MPRWILSERNTELSELMDDPACDPVRLARTYDWFARLNPWLARWYALYRSHIRPALKPDGVTRILDVGCGGGDVLRLIGHLAAKEDRPVTLTGIDPDERAIGYAVAQDTAPGVLYRPVHSSCLVEEGASYDIILSNHVLHHLNAQEVSSLMADCEALTRGLVLHNDICRDDLALLSYAPLAWWPGRNSFILTDGMRSIRRAWHPMELRTLVSPGWSVERVWPFRLLLVHRGGAT